MIDFRSGYFSSPHGLLSFYYSPVGLTINALPEEAKLYQDSVDGLGVIYDYESDEVEGSEFLDLHFNVA